MTVKLYEGDSREILRQMQARGEFVHSVVTDPPYGLVSVTKRFGKTGSAPAKHGRDGAFARQSRGFMGKKWDGSQIERDPAFWRLVYDVMLPGAYIVAFSSSRTYHHMAVAMEAAGFITHPMIGWTFASGMPKAHSAARAIDQALGKRGTVIPAGDPVRRIRPGADQNKDGSWEKLDDRFYQPGAYAPATDEASAWQGWAYGGQVRKPALEPVYIGQKPFSERNGALNILKHGVGAVNVDACRVPAQGRPLRVGDYKETDSHTYSGRMDGSLAGDSKVAGTTDLGRWPANLIHDGSPEVEGLFPNSKGAAAVKGTEPSGKTDSIYGHYDGRAASDRTGDQEGSAARFFESYAYRCFECRDSGYVEEWGIHGDVQDICPSCAGACLDPSPFDERPIFHHAKASKKDRAGSKHPTIKPLNLIAALVRHVTPPGGIVLDPFAGSGTLGQVALDQGFVPVLIEMDPDYCNDIRRRLGLPLPVSFDFSDLLGGSPLDQFEDLLGAANAEKFEDLFG